MPNEINIGESATIKGQNYEGVFADNSIWFEGGVQGQVTNVILSSPNNIIEFFVPAAAVSTKSALQDSYAHFYVPRRNDLTSNPPTSETAVLLHNQLETTFSIIRTIGYNITTGDYWVAGKWNGINGFVRLKYDSNPKSPTENTRIKNEFAGTYSGI